MVLRPCPVVLCPSVFKYSSWLAKHIAKDHKGFQCPVGDENPEDDMRDDSNHNDDQDDLNIEQDEVRPDLTLNDSFWDNNQRIPIPSNAEAAEIMNGSDEDSDEESSIKNGTMEFENAGKGVLVESRSFIDLDSPFWPFLNEEDYDLAKWFIDTADIKACHIDAFFKANLGLDASLPRSFKSSHTLRRQIDLMPDGLGWESWMRYTTETGWSESNSEPIIYYCRNPIEIAEWLLSQPCHRNDMVYGPVREYVDGQRIYSEMHTADWWWEMQVIGSYSSFSRLISSRERFPKVPHVYQLSLCLMQLILQISPGIKRPGQSI
jgi:hypothetical protein